MHSQWIRTGSLWNLHLFGPGADYSLRCPALKRRKSSRTHWRRLEAAYRPSDAAAQLGMPASTLESNIRSLKIDKFRFRPSRSILSAPRPTATMGSYFISLGARQRQRPHSRRLWNSLRKLCSYTGGLPRFTWHRVTYRRRSPRRRKKSIPFFDCLDWRWCITRWLRRRNRTIIWPS